MGAEPQSILSHRSSPSDVCTLEKTSASHSGCETEPVACSASSFVLSAWLKSLAAMPPLALAPPTILS